MSAAAKLRTPILREARNWMALEQWEHDNRSARRVITALESGCDCDDLAVEWLRQVSRRESRQAMWAAAILRQLQADGQIRGAK